MSRVVEDDVVSEVGGDDPFAAGVRAGPGAGVGDSSVPTGGTYGVGLGNRAGTTGFTRSVPTGRVGWGKGPVAVDKRKFRYDTNAAMTRGPLAFGATKVDRMDASEAGKVLHELHKVFGIEAEAEERIYAFDQALWYEHAVNGGSTLQAERGVLRVGEVEFDIPVITKVLGVHARRFFRAYADDIAACLAGVVGGYNPYDAEAAEKYGAVMQVAVARGLQKYPHLIHDSSDAGIRLSIEERTALQASKRFVIGSTVNRADAVPGRAEAGFAKAGAEGFDSV